MRNDLYQEMTFVVEADNEESAKEKAYKSALITGFAKPDQDYEDCYE